MYITIEIPNDYCDNRHTNETCKLLDITCYVCSAYDEEVEQIETEDLNVLILKCEQCKKESKSVTEIFEEELKKAIDKRLDADFDKFLKGETKGEPIGLANV